MNTRKITDILKESLKKGSFARHVLTLMTGTASAQALTIIIAPVLTRLYTPEDFGILALFVAIVGILSIVICWCYELSIVLPEKDEDAANLLVLSIIIGISMSLITLMVVGLFRHSLANLLGAPKIAFWLWFVPLSLVGFGFFQAFNYWCTRKKQFKQLAVQKITQSITTNGTQLGAGFFLKPGPGGLIGGYVIGNTVATGILGWRIWLKNKRLIKNAIQFSKIKELALKYTKFPRYSALNGLLNTTSQQLPGILFTIFFGSIVLGYYYLAYRIFSVPMSLLGQSFAQVFYPKASEYYKTNADIRLLVRNSYKILLKISILPSIFLFIFGPTIFAFVFGNNWRIAGEYLRLILPWLTVAFIVSPSTFIFPILNRQDTALAYEAVLFVARLLSILIGGLILKNATLTIGLYGAVGFLAGLYLIFLINRLLNETVSDNTC